MSAQARLFTPQRRRRRDAGLVKATARDLELLRYAGEQCALSLPQLARLMGRSEHAARWLRDRWERAGWARGAALVVGRPVLVWPTRAGMRLAGLEFRAWRPNPGAVAHIVAVNEVRAHIAERRPEAVWVCERELLRGRASARAHVPDALVVVGDQEAAVEVELTQKSRRRAEAIMRELASRHDSVWYFTTDATRRVVERAAEAIGADSVQVLALPEGPS
jgi:DNA-binding Lrp family transcriptional regulator